MQCPEALGVACPMARGVAWGRARTSPPSPTVYPPSPGPQCVEGDGGGGCPPSAHPRALPPPPRPSKEAAAEERAGVGDASEGKGPPRWPQRRSDRRLEGVCRSGWGAVTVGCKCDRTPQMGPRWRGDGPCRSTKCSTHARPGDAHAAMWRQFSRLMVSYRAPGTPGQTHGL